jgi:F-type H+-transporting ATPase subunit gamma
MAQVFTGKLIDLFLSKKIDEVVLIYHHFKNRANQILTVETFLPIQLKPVDTNQKTLDYIVEPDKTTIVNQLIPSVLKLKFYTVHSDSVTSEHAARAMAMQIATDNADDLISELTIQHNKLRQQSITNELLDIVSGSFGKKK